MTIEFDKIELEGDAAEALKTLLANETFTKYISDSVANREQAVRTTASADVEPLKLKIDEFRATNVTLKEQLEKFDGFDPDEYKRLKSLGSDAQAANEQIKRMEIEHKGQIDGLSTQNDSYKTQVAELEQKGVDNEFMFDARSAISRHNMTNKTVALEDGAEETLVHKMMQSRKVIDNKIIMLDNGTEFTTDAGIGSLDDWVNVVGRRDFPFLFKKPAGGGAPGSNTSGAGSKQMTRSEFAAESDPVRKSEIARTYTITD